MLFNSLQFFLFFIIVYSLYLALSHRWQNRMLLVASYLFYGAWSWKFLFLILTSTLLDYNCGLKIYKTQDRGRKKLFLFFSICGNLTILGFFKYYNFFAHNLQSLLSYFGFSFQPLFLNIILPVGISFYTFQTMSYTIDVFRGELQPARNFFDYALYVSFFPQLLAGPIERATLLLPQILSPRKVSLEKFSAGCYLIFWGLFQKMFIADNLARIVDPVFTSTSPSSGVNVLMAVFAFAFQILCDFAGYSNIARGLGKCLGFDIIINFNLPYFSTSLTEFWRRYHISMSSWFRDYVYTPLVINKRDWGVGGVLYALFISFVVIGLWHGAEWKFVLFGLLQGVVISGELLTRKARKKLSKRLPAWSTTILGIAFTFGFFSCSCLFFRAQSVPGALFMIRDLVGNFSRDAASFGMLKDSLFYIWPLIAVQCLQYRKNDLLAVLTLPAWMRGIIYFAMYYLLVAYGVEGGKEFIYFQF
jgi:D-alanyl-lipoteichoic acid acyltransferase DltB (MBOAT superfamily)